MKKKENIIKVLCIGVIISCLFALIVYLGMNKMYNDKVAELQEYDVRMSEAQTELLTARRNAGLSRNQDVERDSAYLEQMFNDIFTFYDMEDFDECKKKAKNYGLPREFVEEFYSKRIFSEDAYAETIDVMSNVSECKLYCYENNKYIADVDLSLVRYAGSIRMVILIELDDDNNIVLFKYKMKG